MFKYFKMKKNEIKVKYAFYGTIASFIDNQADVVEFLKKLYESLKDVNGTEFKNMLIEKIVELSASNKE